MSNSDELKSPVATATKRGRGAKSSLGLLALAAVVGFYSLVRPAINERTGLDLPAVRLDSQGQIVAADDKPIVESSPKVPAESVEKSSVSSPSSTAAAKEASATKSTDRNSGTKKSTSTPPAPSAEASAKKPGPLADRIKTTKPESESTDQVVADDPSLKFGLLREIGKDRYISPAGLLYTPGSAEGHRIEHVRRHTKDDPNRPGSHGVFDGGMEGALKVIDQAYEKAKQGVRTTKSTDDGRIIYTVDMGRRVGYVGGRDGGRNRNPMARRVRLVLEGTRVITAYPM